MYPIELDVRRSIICNSLKVGATHTSIGRWMEKQNVVNACGGILFSLKKYTHEPGGPYAECNKPDTERQVLYDSTFKKWIDF